MGMTLKSKPDRFWKRELLCSMIEYEECGISRLQNYPVIIGHGWIFQLESSILFGSNVVICILQ